ncbi:MAG TPA: hypothetical protein VH092_31550 [Urbifossiella sp.]|jgi:hypothetical protein|nr:hypothetical protein [Urbifossiella sp.]
MWLLSASVAAASAAAQADRLDELMGGTRLRRAHGRELATDLILSHLLVQRPEELAKYKWRVFVPGEDDPNYLVVPNYAPTPSTTAWPIGYGVTGTAFESGEPEFAMGPEIAAKYPVPDGLIDAASAERHARLQVVAAVPLTSSLGRPVGVLTAHSDEWLPYLTTTEGQGAHLLLAAAVARVLIDIYELNE